MLLMPLWFVAQAHKGNTKFELEVGENKVVIFFCSSSQALKSFCIRTPALDASILLTGPLPGIPQTILVQQVE